MKILVLEDESERRPWFAETFAGCEITFTARVEPTLKALRREEYDLIFLDRDLGQPKENGEDVAWQMKTEGLAKNAIVVAHTVNPHGQRAIERYLKDTVAEVHVIPFPTLRKMKREDFLASS